MFIIIIIFVVVVVAGGGIQNYIDLYINVFSNFSLTPLLYLK